MRTAGIRLIDATGQVYDGLDDFQAGNDLLGADDLMLVPRNLVAVPGEGSIITVPGHPPATWPWWLLGGVLGAGGVAGVVVVRRRPDARRDGPG